MSLYKNIHAKRKRIQNQKASGAKKVERMRSPELKVLQQLKHLNKQQRQLRRGDSNAR